MLNYQRKGLTMVMIGLIIGFVCQIFLSFGGSTESAATDTWFKNQEFLSLNINWRKCSL